MKQQAGHKHEVEKPSSRTPMMIEVLVRQPHRDCPVYTWDYERESLLVMDMYHAEQGFPADLASIQLEGKLDVPVLLLGACSFPPGTLAQARLLGALSPMLEEEQEHLYPLDDWIFVVAAEVDASLSSYHSIEMLPPAQLDALKAYARIQLRGERQHRTGGIQLQAANGAARCIRETRLLLKQEQRMQPKGKGWLKREEEERPVAWRAIEGLAEALRLELQRDVLLQESKAAPHAQAEHLIRFVPERFQKALTDLLLDDERLLAFVERPLLRHRTGLLGMQTWRSNEGLFLVTDRQVLWLRDFLAPGSGFLPGGYIAHMAPLERLQAITILPAGNAPDELADRLESKDSPYIRLVMEVSSCTGSELFTVEFPSKAEIEKALAHINGILRAFLPYSVGERDRRVRRLPAVEAWLPRGAEVEQLEGLGGIVPAAIAGQLEERLSSQLKQKGEEELLVSALVPALEEYKSPARLIALTRSELLVIEDTSGKSKRASTSRVSHTEQVHCYDLTMISSAQLRHSLLGSSLSIFVPHPDGRTQRHLIPFHSPAIAWFLPLYTRLRQLLSGPYRAR
jgi:diadenosine tetraphosphatase ApaH/serine/threonine PP2A family protein phosphatase